LWQDILTLKNKVVKKYSLLKEVAAAEVSRWSLIRSLPQVAYPKSPAGRLSEVSRWSLIWTQYGAGGEHPLSLSFRL
jgi:hypothetical protein